MYLCMYVTSMNYFVWNSAVSAEFYGFCTRNSEQVKTNSEKFQLPLNYKKVLPWNPKKDAA
jgi:hypothetical protein